MVLESDGSMGYRVVLVGFPKHKKASELVFIFFFENVFRRSVHDWAVFLPWLSFITKLIPHPVMTHVAH